jgi:hypothetical protein
LGTKNSALQNKLGQFVQGYFEQGKMKGGALVKVVKGQSKAVQKQDLITQWIKIILTTKIKL